jgi:hypothetical protein
MKIRQGFIATAGGSFMLGVEDVTALIRKLGWVKVSHPNPNLLVYENGQDDRGKPVKLVLPNGNDYDDVADKIHSAIDLIAEMGGYTPEQVLQLINPGVFRPYFESAAKSLREVKESDHAEVVGPIVQLRAERDDEEEQYDGRQITVRWDIGNGRIVKIRVALSPIDYRAACDAHRDTRRVMVTGRPEKQGKFWVLTSPSGFKVLPD